MTKRTRKTKEETSLDIWTAIEEIENGVAEKLEDATCMKLSVKNICIQANISRPTLYSYPEIKSYIDENSTKNKSESLLASENNDLKSEISELKEYIIDLEFQRDAALREQYNSLEDLKVKKDLRLVK